MIRWNINMGVKAWTCTEYRRRRKAEIRVCDSSGALFIRNVSRATGKQHGECRERRTEQEGVEELELRAVVVPSHSVFRMGDSLSGCVPAPSESQPGYWTHSAADTRETRDAAKDRQREHLERLVGNFWTAGWEIVAVFVLLSSCLGLTSYLKTQGHTLSLNLELRRGMCVA